MIGKVYLSVKHLFDKLRDGPGMKEPVDVVLSMSDPATFQLKTQVIETF